MDDAQPVAREFLSSAGVDIKHVDERSYPGERWLIIFVESKDVTLAQSLAGDLEEALPFGGASWAGVDSQYFAALWIPQSGPLEGRMRGLELPAEDSGDPRQEPQTGILLSQGRSVELYVGPKDYFLLADLDDSLARVVPVGDWIGPIVVPLLRLLRWVQGHLGNYGWSIVALTVLINLAMGLSKLPVRTFYWVSQLGMLPGTIVYVNAGKELGKIDSLGSILSPSLLISFALLGVLPITLKKLIALYRRKRGASETQVQE